MKEPSADVSREGQEGPSGGTAPMAWVIGDDRSVGKRVCALLTEMGCETQTPAFPLPNKGKGQTEGEDRSEPDIVVLDIGSDVEGGTRAIGEMKRSRIKAPLVVLSEDFSHEFGLRIISQGVRYYFPHDFSPKEFEQVVRNLLQKRSRNK
jgi:DNA-binding response OmpR family regulator